MSASSPAGSKPPRDDPSKLGGKSGVPGAAVAPPDDARTTCGDHGRRRVDPGARLASLVQRHRRRGRAGEPRRARRPSSSSTATPRPSRSGHGSPTASSRRRSARRDSRSPTSPRSRTSRSPGRSPPRPTGRAITTATWRRASPALELMTSAGELVTCARGEPDFDGLVVGLGALGAVVRVTLDVEPAYEVRQNVFEGMSWAALVEHFDAVMASGYSVSAFSRWGERVEQVWVKSRVGLGGRSRRLDELFGARAATVNRHPLIGMDPVNATPQLGEPGPWSDRLPHFRYGVHAEQRRRAPVRVPDAAPSCARRDRVDADVCRRSSHRSSRSPRSGPSPPTGCG